MNYKLFYFFILLPFVFSFHRPETFKIDLDLPPSERFKEVILAKQTQIKKFKKMFLSNLPQQFFPVLDLLKIRLNQNSEFFKELEGVAKYTDSTIQEALAINLIYEILASCTSIVARDSEGYIIHGRNLDYSFGSYIASFMVHYEFYKNGKLLYEGEGNAGFLGLVTGLRRNSFGITLNQRNSADSIDLNEESLRNLAPIPYFLRIVLEKADNFKDAVNLLSEQQFAASAYLIVSGMNKNEGVVLTRDRKRVLDFSALNDKEWFLVQTNYDRNELEPENDQRRAPAEERMRNIGIDNINLNVLFEKVLSQKPNFNSGTISSTIMSARTGVFNTTIWIDDN